VSVLRSRVLITLALAIIVVFVTFAMRFLVPSANWSL